jgi:hypothetical protein
MKVTSTTSPRRNQPDRAYGASNPRSDLAPHFQANLHSGHCWQSRQPQTCRLVSNQAVALGFLVDEVGAGYHPVLPGLVMIQVENRWLLLYSASRWDHAGYTVGAAWCTSPVGPCVKQSQPASAWAPASTDGAAGVRHRCPSRRGPAVVFHAWPDRPHDYNDGSARELPTLARPQRERYATSPSRSVPAAR